MKLEICDVSKQYKDKCAVDHANLTLTPGVWGLLGANGAGKTTLMRMIAGIMKPTGGARVPTHACIAGSTCRTRCRAQYSPKRR